MNIFTISVEIKVQWLSQRNIQILQNKSEIQLYCDLIHRIRILWETDFLCVCHANKNQIIYHASNEQNAITTAII